jgi:hypothetical protein
MCSLCRSIPMIVVQKRRRVPVPATRKFHTAEGGLDSILGACSSIADVVWLADAKLTALAARLQGGGSGLTLLGCDAG